MKIFFLYFLTLFSIIPLYSCKSSNNKIIDVDYNSYINNFEFLQENSSNDTIIKITSPKAILNTSTNDIEIFESSIKISNNKGNDINVLSGKSKLNNTKNKIRVYNNVLISMFDSKNYFIRTNSLDWDLNSSSINLSNQLDINFDNTKIHSSSGIYNINSRLLKINNNIFNRIIFDNEGTESYQIQILSDRAKWFKVDNSLEFISENKQVETTINFLSFE